MVDFTLEDLLVFTQKEKEMIKELKLNGEPHQLEPSDSSVKNLLAYSKALSIRKSKSLKTFTMVLN
jgi:hypothetical protein